MLVLECRSLDSPPAHCLRLIPLLRLSPSSMLVSNGVCMSLCGCWVLESTPLCSQIHSFKDKFAAQNGQKSCRKQKVVKKVEEPGKNGVATVVVATTVRGGHHGWTVVAIAQLAPFFPERGTLEHCLGSRFLP